MPHMTVCAVTRCSHALIWKFRRNSDQLTAMFKISTLPLGPRKHTQPGTPVLKLKQTPIRLTFQGTSSNSAVSETDAPNHPLGYYAVDLWPLSVCPPKLWLLLGRLQWVLSASLQFIYLSILLQEHHLYIAVTLHHTPYTPCNMYIMNLQLASCNRGNTGGIME